MKEKDNIITKNLEKIKELDHQMKEKDNIITKNLEKIKELGHKMKEKDHILECGRNAAQNRNHPFPPLFVAKPAQMSQCHELIKMVWQLVPYEAISLDL